MIDLGINTRWLYLAIRINARFARHGGGTLTVLGTGFVVGPTGGPLWVVTCRHNVDPAWVGEYGLTLVELDLSGYSNPDGKRSTPFRYHVEMPSFAVSPNPRADVAVIDASQFDSIGSPVEITEWLSDTEIATVEEFGSGIAVGDFFVAPGFLEVPDVELDRPVLLSGIIASDPRHPAIVDYHAGTKLIRTEVVLYQSLSRGGMSGAPVYATQRGIALGESLVGPPHRPGRLIGVNSGHLRQGESPLGLSYFTRASEILDAIRASSAS